MAVWVEKYLSAEDREAISQKIAEVESKTSAEIVPVLVPSSTSTGHVPWLLTSLFAIVILSLEGYWLDRIIGTVWMFLTPILLLLAYFLSLQLAKFHFIQRWLTPDTDEHACVWQRAELEFYRARISKTQSRMGVLLLISAMEKRAVILADEGISRRISPSEWEEDIRNLVVHLRAGRWREALCSGLDSMGVKLSREFPIQANDKNEHPDHLIVRD